MDVDDCSYYWCEERCRMAPAPPAKHNLCSFILGYCRKQERRVKTIFSWAWLCTPVVPATWRLVPRFGCIWRSLQLSDLSKIDICFSFAEEWTSTGSSTAQSPWPCLSYYSRVLGCCLHLLAQDDSLLLVHSASSKGETACPGSCLWHFESRPIGQNLVTWSYSRYKVVLEMFLLGSYVSS